MGAPVSPVLAPRLGVCSWSLKPRSPQDLAQKAQWCGVDALQLALDPLRTGAWSVGDTVEALAAAGLCVRSGMMTMAGEDYSSFESIRRTGGVGLDERWPENLAAARANAELAWRLRLPLVSFHAGFLPERSEDTGRPEPRRAVLLDRLRALVDVFAERGVAVGFETGQESAATLLDALQDLQRPAAGVNFDPANLLLYGMDDPVAALQQLLPHVRQVHIKDARRPRSAGEWGEEVPVGTGEVDWDAFLARLVAGAPGVDLMIEREAGQDRIGDVRVARDLVRARLAGACA
jgi:L-ribulose-5-phosphate 3-epimerase